MQSQLKIVGGDDAKIGRLHALKKQRQALRTRADSLSAALNRLNEAEEAERAAVAAVEELGPPR